MVEVEIRALIDAHVHLRQDEGPDGMCSRIAHYTGRSCDQVIAMPNTKPPIHDAADIVKMRDFYTEKVGHGCKVHMTAKWLPRTTGQDVIWAQQAGAIGFKLYPQGATTNAEDGIPFESLRDPSQKTLDFLHEMQERRMVLLCHGEAPGFVLDREYDFLPIFQKISDRFPKLRMTLEHITTERALKAIKELRSAGRPVLGTLTLHHLMTDLNDVIGGKLKPDLFCMPIPKRPEDRAALLAAALSGDSAFALGSDSAPHDQKHKYCSEGCAGVFTAPVLAESLFELFEGHYRTGESPQSNVNLIQNFEKFTGDNACAFYGFQHSRRKLVLKREDHFVPATAGLVASFRGLQTIPWRLKGWWEKTDDTKPCEPSA